MAKNEYPFHKIKMLHRTGREEYANELLKAGWVLLDLEKDQHSEHSYHVFYILGNFDEVEKPLTDQQVLKRELGL